MAEVIVPFCATAELGGAYMLDEDYANPTGIKSVLIDKSKLKIMAKQQYVDVPDVGSVQMCIFRVVGTISYICNAFPVIQSGTEYDVAEYIAQFDNQPGNTASDCSSATAGDVLGWVSAAGCVHVNESIGGDCSIDNMPNIEGVTVNDLAVANNLTSDISPVCTDGACGEEIKRVVKWRGCFVITTSE